ncbi:neurogenic locus notch homolog protein 1-like isoform X2 [Actinia tenebrosa]|uniref:Neurogenic locus notch homolog protein 1-like isoform X2 n=1 Tax=Actinia tenebrosa TaxID=6105 RepID=A0A6P8I5X0_ACTTE|nr:neurogenic locus notch homolog protein 1-like isoform X2 [Actinia tenebrosa]
MKSSWLLCCYSFLAILNTSRNFIVIAADGCKEMDFKVTLQGKTLANHVFKTVRATNDAHCESQCFLDDRCISYGFGTSASGENYRCELSDSDHFMHPDDIVDRPGVIYRSAQNTCTCKGKQYCKYDFITNTGLCLCYPGFTGTNCDININECSSIPCQNSGSCVDKVNGYECKCLAGTSGVNCETNFDDCSPNPCRNLGSCSDKINDFECSCILGFGGKTCNLGLIDRSYYSADMYRWDTIYYLKPLCGKKRQSMKILVKNF